MSQEDKPWAFSDDGVNFIGPFSLLEMKALVLKGRLTDKNVALHLKMNMQAAAGELLPDLFLTPIAPRSAAPAAGNSAEPARPPAPRTESAGPAPARDAKPAAAAGTAVVETLVEATLVRPAVSAAAARAAYVAAPRARASEPADRPAATVVATQTAAESEHWYYYAEATRETPGPFSLADLQRLAADGVVKPATQVHRDGDMEAADKPRWRRAFDVPNLLPPRKADAADPVQAAGVSADLLIDRPSTAYALQVVPLWLAGAVSTSGIVKLLVESVDPVTAVRVGAGLFTGCSLVCQGLIVGGVARVIAARTREYATPTWRTAWEPLRARWFSLLVIPAVLTALLMVVGGGLTEIVSRLSGAASVGPLIGGLLLLPTCVLLLAGMAGYFLLSILLPVIIGVERQSAAAALRTLGGLLRNRPLGLPLEILRAWCAILPAALVVGCLLLVVTSGAAMLCGAVPGPIGGGFSPSVDPADDAKSAQAALATLQSITAQKKSPAAVVGRWLAGTSLLLAGLTYWAYLSVLGSRQLTAAYLRLRS